MKTRWWLPSVLVLAVLVLFVPHALAGQGRGTEIAYPFEARLDAGMVEEAGAQTPLLAPPTQYLPEVIAAKSQANAGVVPAAPEGAAPAAAGVAPTKANLVNAPPLRQTFEGPSYTGWFPPDPIVAVGPYNIVTMVNSSIGIYSKSGSRQALRPLWQFFNIYRPNNFNSGSFLFDPKIVYDPIARRFVIVVLYRSGTTSSNFVSQYIVAISKGSSALGGWWVYRLNARANGGTGTTNWADYPQVGFDYYNVYITSNQFSWGGSFQYSKMRILRKSQLYAGRGVGYWDFWNARNSNGSKVFTWMPTINMTANAYQYLVNTRSSSRDSYVTLWRARWWPSDSRPTVVRVANRYIGYYSTPPDAVQRGSTVRIDTGDCRLLNGVQSGSYIFTTFTQNYSGRSAVRWLGLRTNGTLYLNRTMYWSTGYMFWPAIHVDSSGNRYLGFAASSPSYYASAAYNGWRVTSSSFDSTFRIYKLGQDDYVRRDSGGRNRWGDYSGIARDPSTGHIWVFNEYAATGNIWRTSVARTRY